MTGSRGKGGEGGSSQGEEMGGLEGVGNQVALEHRGSCCAVGQWQRPQADPRPGRGGRGNVCRRGSLTGRECRDTTAAAPVPGTNSKTTCFLLLTPGAQPAPPAPLTLVVVAQLEE